MSVESFIVIFAALAVGSLGKAVTGFGLPLVAIPVMAAFIGVETAVVIMVIPSTLTNVWLMWEHRTAAASIERLWLTIACGMIGIVIGTWLLSRLDDRVLELIMAGWIAVYLLNLLYRGGVRIRRSLAAYLSPPVNFLAGICQGATGIAGPILVTYLHGLRLPAGTHVFLITSIFLSFGVAQASAMTGFGLFTEARLWQSLLALVPVALTMPFGLRLARVINRRVFDGCVIALLLATGIKLAWNGLTGI